MSNGLKQTDNSTGLYATDAAMQETPIADHFISPKELPHVSSIIGNKTGSTEVSNANFDRIGDATSKLYLSSPLMDKGSEANIPSKESLRDDEGVFPPSPPKANRRTPDLDKIAEFFRKNRTPKQSKFLAQFESSEVQDTPESQRRSLSPHAPKTNKRSSSTEFMRVPQREEDASDLEGTALNVSSKIGISKSEKPLEFLKQVDPSGRLKFFGSESESHERMQRNQTYDWEKANNSEDNRRVAESSEAQSAEGREDIEKIRAETSSSNKKHEGVNNGEAGGEQSNERSRLNDTTNEGISVQWVFRPHAHGPSDNSNKSTQVIDPTETQEDNNIPAIISGRPNSDIASGDLNDTQTQIVASFIHQEDYSANETGNVDSSTQIVRSPEQVPPVNTQGTPSTSANLFFEPIMEVPETSSPPKAKEVIDIASSASSSFSKESVDLGGISEHEDSQEKVFLQISSRPEHLLSQEKVQNQKVGRKKESTATLSDAEFTQDLPEVEEQGTQEKKRNNLSRSLDNSFEDSQEITKRVSEKRKQNKDATIEEEANEGYRKHPRKRLRRSVSCIEEQNQMKTPAKSPCIDEGKSQFKELCQEGNNILNGWPASDREAFPTDIKKKDEKYLSKEDINFEDAVWCQYDLNYNFYPGRLLSYDEDSDACWVIFDTGKSLTKNDDIYYLDIRIGDTVNWKGKPYTVVALECRNCDSNTIRCIRGYDTLHLRKKKIGSKLGRRNFIVSLSSISLDLNEWTKRPKVILEEGSHTRAKAFKFLQHPIRGRKNVALSPRKVRVESEKTDRLTYKEESDEYSFEDDTTETKGQMLSNIESSQTKRKLFESKDMKLFEDCVFVLSGLNQDKDELLNLIECFGGTVLDLGFLELFEFEYLKNRNQQMGDEYSLNLTWKSTSNPNFGKFKFACLLSGKHLRSLKYLETLALGWPTLHWNFVEECLRKGKLCTEKLHQYLLPSGESCRLFMDAQNKSGVIKSNNIFHFYACLLQGSLLRDQVSIKTSVLFDYTILLYGSSELDHFIRFILACFGVKQVFQFAGKIGSLGLNNLDVVTTRINSLMTNNEDCKIVIYVNGDSEVSNTILEENKQRIWQHFTNYENLPAKFHVESKEWLIQTIINEDAGFSENES